MERDHEGFLRTSTFAAIATPDQLETLKTVHEGVRAMRHSIQHADERIMKEQCVPEGEPLFPAITNDGIYFAGDHLFLGELAGTVIHVWLVAAAGIEAVASASV